MLPENLLSDIDTYYLISVAKRVLGPYSRADGRKIVIVIDDFGNRRTISYPKYLMEEKLNRPLDKNLETIDHLDRNHDNNSLENLRIVPRDQHSKDDTRRVKLVKFKCSLCNKEFERSPRLVRDKSKKGKSGVFCGRHCAGIYSRKLQLGLINKFPTQPFVESEYYRNIKNIESVASYFMSKYANLVF
jgi:hypothetical protein